MLAFILTQGSWIVLGVIVVLFFAVAYALYTLTASGINKHPYTNHSPAIAPGAALPDEGTDYETFEFQILGRKPRHSS